MMCTRQRCLFNGRSPFSMTLAAWRAVAMQRLNNLRNDQHPRPAMVTARSPLSNRPLGWNPAWAGLTTGVL